MTIGKLHLTALLVAVLAGLLLQWDDLPAPLDERTGPRTMKEVIVLVEKLGLHYRADSEDGTVGARLVISESPLTWQRANRFRLRPKDSDWNGTVAVLRGIYGEIMPVQRMEAWGDFFVYGDPSLIKRLMANATCEGSLP